MTPEDLWLELAQFDAERADGLWDGSAATDDAPAWYGRVRTLLHATQAPATADELTAESEIVGRMCAALNAASTGAEAPTGTDNDRTRDLTRPPHLRIVSEDDTSGPHRRGPRMVRRLVGVKVAAVTTLVALGVTAAAATTGIVTTVVVPALSNDDPPAQEGKPTSPADDGGSSGGGHPDIGDGGPGAGGEGETSRPGTTPPACLADPECTPNDPRANAAPGADPDGTAGTGSATATEDRTQDTRASDRVPDDMAAADATTTTTEPSAEPPPDPTTTTTEPPPTTTTTEPPPDPTTTTTQPLTDPTEPPTDSTTTTTQAPTELLDEEAGSGVTARSRS